MENMFLVCIMDRRASCVWNVAPVRCRVARFKGLVIAAIKVPPERSHAIQSISTGVGKEVGQKQEKKEREGLEEEVGGGGGGGWLCYRIVSTLSGE